MQVHIFGNIFLQKEESSHFRCETDLHNEADHDRNDHSVLIDTFVGKKP